MSTVKHRVKLSTWVQTILHLEGKPYSLKSREFELPFFDNGYPELLLVAGRQVEKSTILAALAAGLMTAFSNYNILYGCPDRKKISQWSHDKMEPFLASPLVTQITGGPLTLDNVEEKMLANGSRLYIRNADPDGDNFRGLSSDATFMDEAQDMIPKAIQVGESSLDHSESPIPFKRYSGTPKTLDNTLEVLWRRSSQTEWLIRCPTCSKSDAYYNNLGINNISPNGLICARCGNPIDARTGSWVHGYPKRYLKGFRVSQLMVPWTNFKDLYYNKLKNRTIGFIMNEVLGISHDAGGKYLTEDEIRTICETSGRYKMANRPDREARSHPIVAGIDWGVNTDDEQGAYTVLVIATCLRPDRIKVIYARKYPHLIHLDQQTELIQEKLEEFKVDFVVADHGAAGDRNNRLANTVGSSNIVQVRYTGSGMVAKKYIDDLALIHLNRTMALSDFRTDLVLKRHFMLPEWESWLPFAEDMLTQHIETNKAGDMMYNHPLGSNDDALMAMVYLNVARRIRFGIPILSTVPNSTFDLVPYVKER